MATPSKQLQEFMAKHKVDHDEIWEIKSGRGAWAIKHSALERIAAEAGIVFEIPHFAEKDGMQKNVAMLVVGKMGERTEWSIGEASPLNYKTTANMPAYPYAMAEKRAKDRVILKLLNTHGAIYSEDEADDFKRQNPHVTRPDDLVPTVEYDDHGRPVDNIPLGDDRITQLPKAKARNEYAAMQSEMLATKTPEALEQWGAANKNRVATLPTDWQEILRGQYTDHMNDLRKVAA
jgi:hypothetical protein